MFHRNEIDIDFKSGLVKVNISGSEVCLNTSVSKEKNRFKVDDAYLGKVKVSIIAAIDNGRLLIDISPPDGLSHEENTKSASLIADEIDAISQKRLLPSQYAQFSWGEVKAHTEWRDGGFGVEFLYRATYRTI